MAMKAVRGASHLVFGPLKYLDALLGPERLAKTPFAYGIYYVGTKVSG
ncbi:MAG: hypothetical protein KC933_00150 [Myxococcales bacterium]|nr:hypothetical protein [Myxococcales bacterium]